MIDTQNLVIGCGDNWYGEKWNHLDITDRQNVDTVHDLEPGELPFETDRFEKVVARHVLEHISKDSLIQILYEISRVTEKGGEIEIVMPHFLSWNAADLDHELQGASRKTFVQFTDQYSMNTPYDVLFKQESIEYDFLDHPIVKVSKKLLGSYTTASFVPNAVNEIQFNFENLIAGSIQRDNFQGVKK